MHVTALFLIETSEPATQTQIWKGTVKVHSVQLLSHSQMCPVSPSQKTAQKNGDTKSISSVIEFLPADCLEFPYELV